MPFKPNYSNARNERDRKKAAKKAAKLSAKRKTKDEIVQPSNNVSDWSIFEKNLNEKGSKK